MNDHPNSGYWFPAKKYGWGWGFPTRWQGWLTMIVFIALVVVDALVFDPVSHPVAFFVGVGLLAAVMVLVCYVKGEPPAWRWGGS